MARVYALAGQATTLWVGGNFRRVNDARALSLAGLDPVSGFPGLTVPTQVQLPGTVLALARQADGKLIAGGEFESVDHVPRENLARLRSDGTLDLGWFPGTDGAVAALAVNATGIYVGGAFHRIGGAIRPYLAKLNPVDDDRPDPGWSPSVGAPGADETRVWNPVASLAIQGSNLFVAGPMEILGGGFGGFAVVDALTGAAN